MLMFCAFFGLEGGFFMPGKAQSRTRNFATVIYPESAPNDWKERLANTHVATFVSPLHDKDVNPDGTLKKAHYHVLIMYENVKTIAQAKSIFAEIGGVGCEIVNTIRGYARYLCHLDNPEKTQYDTDDVQSMNGADYLSIISLATDKYKALREIMAYVRDQNLLSYADLLDYCAENRQDWFRVLCDSGTYVISHYIRSLAYKQGK
jgi:hypothetical protein